MLNILKSESEFRFCGHTYKNLSQFKALPPFLIIETNQNESVSLSEVPKSLKINSKSFRFLCCNFKATRNHFKGIYSLYNRMIQIDDRYTTQMIENPQVNSVDLCFYVLD